MPGPGHRNTWLKTSVVNARREKPAFLAEAACIGKTAVFFPDVTFRQPVKWMLRAEALRVCHEECPVLEECAEWALRAGEGSEHGGTEVWGGMTSKELRRERGRRYRAGLDRGAA
jgi:hypothetical protein